MTDISDVICSLEKAKPRHMIIKEQGIYCFDSRECKYKSIDDTGKQICNYFKITYGDTNGK